MQHSHHRHHHRHKHKQTTLQSVEQPSHLPTPQQQEQHHHHQQQQQQQQQPPQQQVQNNNSDMIRISDLNKKQNDLNDRIRKVKRIILDFRLNNSTDFDDLKTHFSMLENGYCVNLKKVTNSLLQGTLQVIFELLELSLTNRGYVWNEEEVGGRSIFDIFGDCFAADIDSLRASILDVPANSSSTKMDENEIDLDDLDVEDEDSSTLIGPALPPPSVLQSSMEEQPDKLIGPTIPDDILAVLSQGAVVQVENSDEEIGPALPGEETRKPTKEALLQVMEKREKSEQAHTEKKLERCEWMTMLPDTAISSAFAATRPRRFANLPPGCTMDPSWTETPEERERKEREYLSKHVIGGLKEKEPAMSKERERELDAYFEQLDSQRESLSQIYQRVRGQKAGEGRQDDRYSREALFKRPRRSADNQGSGGEFLAHGGSLKSRFGSVSYQAGSL